jgi:protein tyrosine phosphatase
MVWQVQAAAIIKVTREVEGGTLKCHRYWPDPTSEPPQKVVLLGEVSVEYLDSVETEISVTRRFQLAKGGKTLMVTQFSYEAWPGMLLEQA